MLFNSLEFLLFGAAFFALWPAFRRLPRGRYVFLIVASFLFFGWAKWWYPLLLIGNGLIDFAAGLAIERHPDRRKQWLVLSIVGNLLTLGVFKYAGFAVTNLNHMLGWFGGGGLPVPDIILPIGISFTTFTSMSYTIDVYRGVIKPTRDPLLFFAFLALFPPLIAGPIQRARALLPQLEALNTPSSDQTIRGMRWIAVGFFKKTVLADNLAPFVAAAYAAPEPASSGSTWWIIAALYAFQIYFDFSGYSDIARGLGSWIGLDLTPNFEQPYHAVGFREFWQRWHISLSSWFRDYVYIPLGGSRTHPGRALWVTFLLSGLWHGANWTFVAWGGMHAALLQIERWTRWPDRVWRPLGWVLTIVALLLSWALFRSNSILQFGQIASRMLDPRTWDLVGITAVGGKALLWLGLCVVFEFALRWRGWELRPLRRWEPAMIGGMLAAAVYLRGEGGAFIYFQF